MSFINPGPCEPCHVIVDNLAEPIARDLDCALDSVTICPGLDPIVVNQGTTPWVVSGTVTVNEPVTVDAVDFDIRNLLFATDKVDVSGSSVTADTNFDYLEDSLHVSGDPGAFVLAVRNDAGATLVDADLDYAPLQVDSTGALRTSTAPIVIAQSVISAPNSTTTPLAGGATFTGTFVDCLEFADVTITLATSHNSATDGLKVEWSTDGINVDADDVFTILGSAGPGKQYTFGVSTRFVRIRYVNGGTPQTFFRLQTILKRVRGKPSSHRIAETITLQDDAELVKAVIAGETTAGGGSTVNVKVNPSGTLEVNATQETSPWVVSDSNVPDLTGTWAYQAGAAGTEIIGAGQRVIGIAAHAGTLAGSMTINGGDSIPIPANSGISIQSLAQLIAPTIVFTDTDSYFIETVI